MNVRNNFLQKPIPIIFGVKSYKLKKKEKNFFQESNPLGFILFERNCKNYKQTKLLIKDLKKTLPCAAYLNGEYGVKNLYAGVPVIIGNQGVEKVIELSLDKHEKANFDLSIKAVKELFKTAVKIDPDLAY